MFKYWLAAAIFFANLATNVFGQWPGYEKNLIDYRPFRNWSEMDTISPATGTRISLYFPAAMDGIARQTLPEILRVDSLYSHQFFFWNKARPASLEQMEKEKSGWRGFKKFFGFLFNPDILARDSSGKPIIENQLWHPKRVVILLYPNMEDFREQKIFPYIYFPAGVLGFTEYMNNRIALPYGGNWSEFIATLAHEMDHNYSKSFRDSVKRQAGQTKLRKRSMAKDSPLWFDEGSADELARRFNGSGYREARAEEIILELAVTNRLPRLEDLEKPFNFLPYAFGRNFVGFMMARSSDSTHSRIQEYLGRGYEFAEAWQETFGEHLLTSYEIWLKHLKIKHFQNSFFCNADSAIIQPIATRDFSLELSGKTSYDPESRVLVSYFPDEKWEYRIDVVQIDSLRPVSLYHQFSQGDFALRLDNRPAIKNNRVAVSVSKEGRDRVRIYELEWSRKKVNQSVIGGSSVGNVPDSLWRPRVKFVKEVVWSDSGLLWANDLVWENDNLIFVGLGINGQNDVYRLNTATGNLSRLTDSHDDKNQPQAFRDGLIWLATDKTGKTVLKTLTAAGEKTWRIERPGFIDQLVVHDSLSAVRVLEPTGSSAVIFWTINRSEGKIYRYGEKIPGDTAWRAYPLGQLLSLRRDTLYVLNNDLDNLTSNRLRQIIVDNRKQPTVPISEVEKELAMVPVVEREPRPMPLIKPADLSLAFPALYDYRLAVTNVVGDRGVWLDLQSGYNTYRGWNVYGNLGFYDFSSRLIKHFYFYADEGYRFHSNKKNGSPSITYDKVARLGGEFVWPFSLENRIELGVGTGYLWRSYVDSIHFNQYGAPDPNIQGRFRSPIFDFSLAYVHDGVWTDPLRTSKQGLYYASSVTATTTPQHLFLESSFVFDARYYFRPYDDPIYLANRLILGTTFGKDSYWFWWPELYREPGFYNDDIGKSFGPQFILHQSELRIRLVRWLMYPHSFWKNRPLLLLSNNLVFFFYAGGINNSQRWNFAARTGGRLRAGIFFLPVYFGWERYTYCHKMNWQTAWTIELEY